MHEQLAGPAGAGLNFIGNIEGTQVTENIADVVVMDGFTGNIVLKLTEGVSARTLRAVREAAMSSWRGRVGGLLLSSSVRKLQAEIDPEDQGGAYLLGLRRLGVIAHGRFSAPWFRSCHRGRGPWCPGGSDRPHPPGTHAGGGVTTAPRAGRRSGLHSAGTEDSEADGPSESAATVSNR